MEVRLRHWMRKWPCVQTGAIAATSQVAALKRQLLWKLLKHCDKELTDTFALEKVRIFLTSPFLAAVAVRELLLAITLKFNLLFA